jgi:hypothetical protein
MSLAIITLFVIAFSTPAIADCDVGTRVFVQTLTLDAPCVDDELLLPAVSFQDETEIITGELDKTITKNFGVGLQEQWVQLKLPGEGTRSGFDNLLTSFNYQLVRNVKSETAMTAALVVDWGGTGNRAVADPFTTLTPTWNVGQGFGFLPESMKFLRPFGITAALGYSFPTESSTTTFDGGSGLFATIDNPQFLIWSGSLQYSMSYLKSKVQNLGLPDFVNHLNPIIEWDFQTQVQNFNGEAHTTGTINPGLVYLNEKIQLSLEAIIPVNSASGDGVGVIGALHFHTEEFFPHTLGKPIFGSAWQGGAED